MSSIATVIGDILSFLTITSCLVWVVSSLCGCSSVTNVHSPPFRSKLPQIQTIYRQKSAKGISLKSLTIEVISYSVSTLYNFTNRYRWTNYFEYVILIVQDYILIICVLFYRREINRKTLIIFLAYSSIVSLFAFDILPNGLLTYLIVSSLNWKRKHWNIVFYF